MASCSACKVGGKEGKGVHSESCFLSSHVTVTLDGALLSWRWLNTSLLMGRSE